MIKTISFIKYNLIHLVFILLPCVVNAQFTPELPSVYERALPSVVKVFSQSSNNYNEVFVDSSHYDMSDQGLISNNDPNTVSAGIPNNISSRQGSGFIFRSDGYILTASHILKNATSAMVVLYDGLVMPAEILFVYDSIDVAILKIEHDSLNALNFPIVPNQTKFGEPVFTIGSPYNYISTISTGVVSNLHRQFSDVDTLSEDVRYIQTDININPGNSGGPIINSHGEVIGMNSRIFSPTGSSIGISFAISYETITTAIKDFITYAVTENEYLGFSISEVTEERYKDLGLPRPVGLYVSNIVPGSITANSGLQINDVIVTANRNLINSYDELINVIDQDTETNSIKITAIRNGKLFSTNLFL